MLVGGFEIDADLDWIWLEVGGVCRWLIDWYVWYWSLIMFWGSTEVDVDSLATVLESEGGLYFTTFIPAAFNNYVIWLGWVG
jgi:hypothetical protein